MYVCGSNSYGQLGLGDLTNRDNPTLLPNFNNVKSVYVGYYSSMIILSKKLILF